MAENRGPDDVQFDAADARVTEQRFEALAETLIGLDLDAWFASKERQAQLVALIVEETSCPKLVVSITVRVLAPVVCHATKGAAGWLLKAVGGRLLAALVRIKGVEEVVSWFEGVAATIDGKLEAKRALEKEIFALSPDLEAFKGQMSTGLLADMATASTLDEMRAMLERLAKPQPTLDLRVDDKDASNAARFVYRTRYVPFMGRNAEMAKLDGFLDHDSDKMMRWTLVHGVGGIGKSRLALEFALQKAGAFAAGFLSSDEMKGVSDKEGWGNWQPVQPTLIIVDYAATNPELVAKLISGLAARQPADVLEAPVRVLLLERSAEGPWLDTIRGVSKSWKTPVENAFFGFGGDDITNSLPLGPLADIWPFIEKVIEKAGRPLPDREQTLATLENIDDQKRPLYAAFLADAIARGEDPRKWDRRRLVEDVLEYEREKYWKPAGVTDQHEVLLVLATMVDGIKFEEVAKLCKNDGDGLFPPWSMIDTPTVYSAVHGYTLTEALPSLQPDIFGEVFALTWLKDNSTLVEPLGRLAWDGAPLATWQFLDRLAGDFPEAFPLDLFMVADRTDELQSVSRALLAVNLISKLGDQKGRLDDAVRVYDELQALASERDEPAIWLWQAKGAFNLLDHLSKHKSRLDDAARVYDDLKGLAADRDEPEIWVEQAKGATNLINRLGDHESRLDDAARVYDDLKGLAAACDDAAIWLRQARGAVNLSVRALQCGRPEEVPGLDDWQVLIERLANGLPDAPADAVQEIASQMMRWASYIVRKTVLLNSDEIGPVREAIESVVGDEPMKTIHALNEAMARDGFGLKPTD